MTKLTISVAVALLGVAGLAWGCEDRAMLDAAAVFPANASQKPVVTASDAVANNPAATKKTATKQVPAAGTIKQVNFVPEPHQDMH